MYVLVTCKIHILKLASLNVYAVQSIFGASVACLKGSVNFWLLNALGFTLVLCVCSIGELHILYEPRHKKTGFLPRQNQRCRSASQLLRSWSAPLFSQHG